MIGNGISNTQPDTSGSNRAQPELMLWSAVIKTAVSDLSHHSPTVRRDAWNFLHSNHFAQIVSVCGADPDEVRNGILQTTGINDDGGERCKSVA